MGKEEASDNNEKNEQPPGGRDKTPLRPSGEQTYTVKITFHSIQNLPVSDMGKRSSDPYIIAQINANVGRRNDHDPFLRFRSQTFHRNRDPEVNSTWTVAGVPASGMTLKIRVYDEDPDDYDDRLGKLAITTGRLDDKFELENSYKLSKRGASTRAYTLRWCSTMVNRHKSSHAVINLSIEVIGPTKEEVGKIYTMSTFWRIHYSPIIGRFAGTTTEDDDTGVKRFDFQANELQLQGPVPNELYHRYVEFKSFVRGMFTGEGLRGRILHKALHHQHERIYTYNESTKYGDLEGPGRDMALKFLDMVHYDEGGRIFTYVITLDGLMRFTETGKEFGIDLLSKHTMHSDVNIYIACSGEFLVRRLQHPEESAEDADQHTHPAEHLPGGPPDDKPPKDPALYELIIDNDSGTYRPDAELLPKLKSFLEKNFEGLHIVVKDCADKELEKIKDEQRKAKERESRPMVYGQGSDSGSISSSDASDLEDRAQTGGEGPEDSPGQDVKRAAAVFDRPVNAAKHAFK